MKQLWLKLCLLQGFYGMLKMTGAGIRMGWLAGWLAGCLTFLLSRWPGIIRESDSCQLGDQIVLSPTSYLAYRKTSTRRNTYKKNFMNL